MIRYRIQDLAKRRGIENASQLAEYADITPPKAYRVWDEKPLERIEVATLEALATAFKRKPWTLLEHTPDPE